jgi:hypothetical protein
MEFAPCTSHPERRAGWSCSACGARLCAESCAAWRTVGQGTIEVCLLCGGPATPLRVRRAVLEPFGVQAIKDAVRWPFHREGILTAAVCAVVLWLLGLAGLLAGFFGFGIALAVCFHVTRTSAEGEDEFREAGDFLGFFEGVLGPVFRASLAAIWAYGPIVAFMIWRGRLLEGGSVAELHGANYAVALLLLAVGVFLFPMALLTGALSSPLQQILNPMVVIGYAVKLGRDYALLAGFALAISLTDSFLMAVLDQIDQRVLSLPTALEYFVLLLPPLMLFRAMGMLVRVRGDELGYGGESGYLVPVLGKLRPATRQRGPELRRMR